MTVLRFAQIGPWLEQAARGFRRNAMPYGAVDWATDIGMNALMGLGGAAALPQGTSAGLRAGAFAESLASVPIGWAGRGAGYKLGQLLGQARGKELSAEGMNAVQALTGTGLEMGLYATGLMPAPFFNKAMEDYNARMQDEQQRQMAERDAVLRQQAQLDLLEEIGPMGAFVAPLQQSVQSFGLMG